VRTKYEILTAIKFPFLQYCTSIIVLFFIALSLLIFFYLIFSISSLLLFSILFTIVIDLPTIAIDIVFGILRGIKYLFAFASKKKEAMYQYTKTIQKMEQRD
jgi:hypothetical protein